jgi:D-amino-acid dehydrogenase
MRVIVMGAGVIGVTSAWYLAQAGHEVTVVDRQPAAAQETSFANGGQISVGHAEPWAGPQVPWQLLSWIGHEASPLLWRLRWDIDQWRWGLGFLAQCSASRARENTEALVRLGLHSRDQLQILRCAQALEYDQLERGILRIYTSERELARIAAQTDVYNRLGCERIVKTPDQCVTIEPGLRDTSAPLVGGVYTPADESGDACKFTQQLEQRCIARGVVFRYGETVTALQADAHKLAGVRLASGEILHADAYVVALGSYTPLLLKPLGLRVPVYPAKGYSLTIPLAAEDRAPDVSLTDDEHKIVFSRLGNSLRVAGTAEFNGYDTSLNQARCDAIASRVRQLFPHLSQLDNAVRWAGLRPATPGNVPLIGPTRVRNLYLNTGHGTLGWTLACGSAQILADMVSGRETAVDAGPYLP